MKKKSEKIKLNIDILQNYKQSNYSSTPYPHIVIENALPEVVYNQLEYEYELIINYLKKNKNFNQSNKRLQVSTSEFILNKEFKNTLWLKFVKYHTSKFFFFNLMDIFKKDFFSYYPNLFQAIFKNRENNNFMNIRSSELSENKKFHIVADCQPGINTPVTQESSVRGPHVDNPVEIFGGLYYLKNDNDIAGGDLEIFSIKKKPYFKDKAEIHNTKDLLLHSKIKYKKNLFIIFLNSLISIHGISKRKKTIYTRNLTNIIFETYSHNKLFKMNRKISFFNNIYAKIFN